MTQPVCAYEGCGRSEFFWKHTVRTSDEYHPFQPPSTVESAPVKECSHCKGLKEIRVSDESVMACPFCVPCDWGCSKTMYCVSCRIHTPKPAAQSVESAPEQISRSVTCEGGGIGTLNSDAAASPSSGAGEVCMHKVPFSQPCEECVNHFAAYVPFPASTSPQGAGEQWKPDCDIEAMRNALSKLESQVCRNPDLPEAYKTILRDGFKAVGNIELRLKAGAQGAGGCTCKKPDFQHAICPVCDYSETSTAGFEALAKSMNAKLGAQGAVPGPQEGKSKRRLRNEIRYLNERIEVLIAEIKVARAPEHMRSTATPEPLDYPLAEVPHDKWGANKTAQMKLWMRWLDEVADELQRMHLSHEVGSPMRINLMSMACKLRQINIDMSLATPEPHSPHVHNFDANGICVTMGCTPAEKPRKEVGYCFATFEEFGCTLVKGHRGQHEAHGSEPLVTWPSAEPAASTDERLAEIAEPDLKELIEDFGIACVRFGSTEDGSVEESEAAAKSNKLHDDLLRLVAELRDDLKTVNEAWHADLVQWGQEQKAATARAEQAERERDRLAGPNPTP